MMLPISCYTLVALTLASSVATSNLKSQLQLPFPHVTPPPQPLTIKESSFVGSDFERVGGRPIVKHVIDNLQSERDVLAFCSTCSAGYVIAHERLDMVAAKEVAIIMASDNDRVFDELTKVRDKHRVAIANGQKPLLFPSCFNPIYTSDQRKNCLLNLWHVACYHPDIIAPDWIIISLALLLKSAMKQSIASKYRHDLTWKLKDLDQLAERQTYRISQDIGLREHWSAQALDWLASMRLHIQRLHKTDSKSLRNAVSARLCVTVAYAIDSSSTASWRHATWSVIDSLRIYLNDEKREEVVSVMLQDNELHREYIAQYNPSEGVEMCSRRQPGVYDIVRGLLRFSRPPFSRNDRTEYAKTLDGGFSWYKVPVHGAAGASRLAEKLKAVTAKDLTIVIIQSALSGKRPGLDVLNRNKSADTRISNEWLQWQVRLRALEYFAAIDKASLATVIETVKLLGEMDLVPKWVTSNHLKESLASLCRKA